MRSSLLRQVSTVLTLFSVLVAALPAAAQRRGAAATRTAASAPAKSEKRAFCQGGWTGVVTLTKTLVDSHESDEPGIRKKMDRIIQKSSRNYRYKGRAIVASSDPYNPRVNASVDFSDDDRSQGLEKVFDTCNSRENGHWFTIEGTDFRKTTAQASGPARHFNLNVDEMNGTYSLSLKLPDAVGKYERKESLRRAGHCQAKNNEPWDRDTKNDVKVEGESVSVINEKLDPDKPDQISGSKTWGDDGKGQVRTFVFHATWRFTRCPQKLLITDLRFEHPEYPNPDKWVEVIEQRGTIDGNRVKVRAKVVNMSDEAKFAEIYFKETYKGDHWNGSMPDRPLNDNTVSIRLEPGEEREVEVLWNSSGYAWFDDGRPRTVQRIKAEAWENFKKQDEMTKNLKVAPKPLILVTGLWSDANTFSAYQNYLTTAHSYDWKAVVFDDNVTGNGVKPTGHPRNVFDYADALEQKVRKAQQELNAWHVDMAAHSTGGLISRVFVHKFGNTGPYDDPRVKHLMLMGTPNAGIACTDALNREFDDPQKIFSAKELLLEEMRRFNQFVMQRHGTKFSALVGKSISMLCAPLVSGDGVVEPDSASAGSEDVTYVSDRHADLASSKNFWDHIRPRLVTGPRGTYPLRK